MPVRPQDSSRWSRRSSGLDPTRASPHHSVVSGKRKHHRAGLHLPQGPAILAQGRRCGPRRAVVAGFGIGGMRRSVSSNRTSLTSETPTRESCRRSATYKHCSWSRTMTSAWPRGSLNFSTSAPPQRMDLIEPLASRLVATGCPFEHRSTTRVSIVSTGRADLIEGIAIARHASSLAYESMRG